MRFDRGNGRSFLSRVAVELIVVFVGVYAAFALSSWQETQRAAERRSQIQAALVREIRDITDNTRRAASWSAELVAFYDSAFADGGMPPLTPMIEPVRVESHMWEATLASGGLDLLDVPTIYRLSQFYNELNAGFEQLAQLRGLSESLLIPNLGRDTGEFYAGTGELRPKYAWYLSGLRRLNALAGRITATGDRLVSKWTAGAPVEARR